MNYIDENKKIYDKIAKPFASTRLELWDDMIPLRKYTKNGDHVLDIGCGTGRLYQLFEDMSIAYVGLDQSKNLLKFAKKEYPKGRFILGEMTKLPFEDNEFNIIYCIATFHHLPDQKARIKALEEMKRVLKPEGLIVMTNWNLDSDWAKEKLEIGNWKLGDLDDHFVIPFETGDKKIHGWRHYWKLTFEYLEELFKEIGLKLEKQYYSTRGKKTDIKKGDNIVSVVRNSDL